MSKRKICVVTGSRAEYGLLYWLLKEIETDKKLELQLIVTGMHLSPEFGLTYKEIEKDFKIEKKINIDLSSDTSVGISKSIGLAQSYFAEAYNKLEPDIILVVGDRYEVFGASIAAMISKIPIAHIHGGEITKGSWDDNIRHCISKLAHLHFVATKEYKRRVIQLGEMPERVFLIGGLGIENIKKMKLLSKIEFEKSINFKLNKKNMLVTFHPETIGKNSSKKHFKELLDALSNLKDTNIIFTKSNSDLHGKAINKMIDQFCSKHKKKTISFASLGQLNYLSALKHVDMVIGNSSSGILEAPSFKLATLNIGDRQTGRIKAKSIVDCFPKKKDIINSINKIYSRNFQMSLQIVRNPYDKGLTSKKITKVLKNFNIKNITEKIFYDL